MFSDIFTACCTDDAMGADGWKPVITGILGGGRVTFL